jgi:hypothetical protein
MTPDEIKAAIASAPKSTEEMIANRRAFLAREGMLLQTYRVRWEIDIEAETPREAAEKALAIRRKPDSIATVFDVWVEGRQPDVDAPETIDLTPDDDDDTA